MVARALLGRLLGCSGWLLGCSGGCRQLLGCHGSQKQCLILTSALKSNPSHLRELNLSENQITNTGVNHLCDVLKDSLCKLERLRSVTFTYKNT